MKNIKNWQEVSKFFAGASFQKMTFCLYLAYFHMSLPLWGTNIVFSPTALIWSAIVSCFFVCGFAYFGWMYEKKVNV